MNYHRILFVIMFATVSLVTNGFAQGTVNFSTLVRPNPEAAPEVDAPVRYLDGTGVSGNSWFAQLYSAPGVGANESSLTPAGIPINFRGGLFAGYVQTSGTTSLGQAVNPVVTVTPVAGGGATVQMRVWGSSFSTYEDAVAGGGIYGFGNLLSLASTGGAGTPPAVPVNLLGLEGLVIPIIPEPSSMAIASFALAILLLRRRK